MAASIIIGYLVSFIFFISPLPTFIHIITEGNTNELSVKPYLATFVHLSVWTLYGSPIIQSDQLPFAVINGIGVLFEVVYVIVFLCHSNFGQIMDEWLCKFLQLLFLAVVAIEVKATPFTSVRISFVGSMGVLSGLFMYAPPPFTLRRPMLWIDYMLSLNFLCKLLFGCGWFIYGLIVSDMHIMIAHGIGLICGAFHLIRWMLNVNSRPDVNNLRVAFDPRDQRVEMQPGNIQV